MIHSLSLKLATYIAKSINATESLEIYQYGLECFLNEIFIDILLLIYGFFLNDLQTVIIWNISFLLIQINIDSYHASTHFRCILLSTFTGILGIHFSCIIAKFDIISIPIFFLFFYSSLLFFISDTQSQKQKIFLYLSITFFIILLNFNQNTLVSATILSGIFCSMIIPVYQKLIITFKNFVQQ